VWTAVIAVVVAALAYTAWLSWRVQDELRSAEASATQLQAAWRSGDPHTADRAASQLAEDATAARSHTSGIWWRSLGHLPFVGDDARGVAAMSRSLDVVAHDAVAPLGEAVDGVDGLLVDGRIDLPAVARLQEPVRRARRALTEAAGDVDGLDSGGYVGILRTRFDRYVDLVDGLRDGLDSADRAIDVLPTMAGADGPRNYLLLFQNNAEIRPTGGMPGSWALLRAVGGKIKMARQGTARDFPMTSEPVLPLTAAETAVYGKELGTYFQDPGFSPDFPRAAALWRAHWDRRFPATHLDGVVALDPVGMSYLLEGTGPVSVGDTTLTSENAVEELLNRPYIEDGVAQQDAFFASASKAILAAATGSLASPAAFVEGLNRAAQERRLLVASFDEGVARRLAGTRVEGAFPGDDGSTPHVDVTLSDLTGSKMSYYLRYNARVEAVACRDGVQRLTGSATISQVISPGAAAQLPASVTGGGRLGTEPGAQYVMVRVYGPYGGTVDDVRLNGRAVRGLAVTEIAGRPVVNVDVLLSSRRDLILTWTSDSGAGQTGVGDLRMTPSVVPGAKEWMFPSAC
jgi:hypothetical protein